MADYKISFTWSSKAQGKQSGDSTITNTLKSIKDKAGAKALVENLLSEYNLGTSPEYDRKFVKIDSITILEDEVEEDDDLYEGDDDEEEDDEW